MLDFLGIGAQKAGTTWLYRMLGRHPAVRFPGGKERHFWSRPDEDMAGYLGLFADAPAEVRQGEITPAYALLDAATIDRIRAVNPALRIIFVIRNPLERAWSSAMMALQRAELRYEEASDQWFLDHFRSSGSLGRGNYEATLRRWHAAFSAEQLLLLRYEQLRDDPRALLHDCGRHLGLDSAPFDALPDALLHERVFPGPGIPVRPSLRAPLCALYGERVDSLARYTGLDLRSWHGLVAGWT